MPMIDLMEQADTADGVLVKYTAKADGKDEDAYVYEVDLAFTVEGTADAEILSKVVPGSMEVRARADDEDDNWKFRVTVVPDLTGVKASLQPTKGKRAPLEGSAEVKSVAVRASKRGMTAILRLVFGGQTAKTAATLTGMLGCAVRMSTDFDQQVLRFPTSVRDGSLERGDIVTAQTDGGVWVVGRVDEIQEHGIKLADFGNSYMVDPSDVVSSIQLAGDVSALRNGYKNKCETAGVTPTWEALVIALAEDAGVLEGGTHKVDFKPGHVKRACELLQEGAGEILPPEPGEIAGS